MGHIGASGEAKHICANRTPSLFLCCNKQCNHDYNCALFQAIRRTDIAVGRVMEETIEWIHTVQRIQSAHCKPNRTRLHRHTNKPRETKIKMVNTFSLVSAQTHTQTAIAYTIGEWNKKKKNPYRMHSAHKHRPNATQTLAHVYRRWTGNGWKKSISTVSDLENG